jgi:hypothetical protein
MNRNSLTSSQRNLGGLLSRPSNPMSNDWIFERVNSVLSADFTELGLFSPQGSEKLLEAR